MLIRARAPLRISFAGGGTDVPPYPEMEGGCVLSATIARHAYGTLRVRPDPQITIHSVDYGLSVTYENDRALTYDGKLDLVKAAIAKLRGEDGRGLELFLHSEAPPGSGLGASSALTVVLVGLLKELRGLPLSHHAVARLACAIEREDLKIPGGFQDQYAAAFGGFNYIEFHGDRTIVNPLRLSQDILNELQYSLLLVYTGTTRLSGGIIEDQVRRYQRAETLDVLREMKRLTVEMKDALLQRRFHRFGALLHEEWTAKRQLSPRISTEAMDRLYQAALDAGALGGKVTGAGGGGYMLLSCPYDRKHDVRETLAALGGTPTDFTFDPHGLQTWRVPGD